MGRDGARAVEAAAQLVIALDCDRPMSAPSRHVLDGLDEVLFGRGEPL